MTTILVKHHAVTRVLLQRIDKAAAAVLGRHGKYARLGEMRGAIGSFRDHLLEHLILEERDVFPYIVAMEQAERGPSPPRRPPFRSIAEPLGAMAEETRHVERVILALVAALSPARAGCPPDVTWRNLDELVARLAADLRVHAALEQDVLRPAALALEAVVAGRLRGT